MITIFPTFLVLGVLTFLLWKWLKDKDEKFKLIPIKIIAVILVVIEIIKQIDAALDVNGYRLKALPLFYCSLFLYLYPIMAFYNGKHKNAVRNLTLCSGTALIALMLIMPRYIYLDSNIKNFFEFITKNNTKT